MPDPITPRVATFVTRRVSPYRSQHGARATLAVMAAWSFLIAYGLNSSYVFAGLIPGAPGVFRKAFAAAGAAFIVAMFAGRNVVVQYATLMVIVLAYGTRAVVLIVYGNVIPPAAEAAAVATLIIYVWPALPAIASGAAVKRRG